MKPETTLKEVLKPPFKIKSDNGCLGIKDEHGELLNFSMQGTRNICKRYYWLYEDKMKFLEFAISALNKEWKQRYGKMLLWKLDECDYYQFVECPECEAGYIYDYNELDFFEKYNYCPSCGVRLLPPGEDGE